MMSENEAFPYWRAFWAWIKAIAQDVRSASVGAVFGAVVAFLGAVVAAGPTLEVVIDTNEDGYAQPALLFHEANEESDEFEIEFSPPVLSKVVVCEYSILRGRRWRDMAFDYLDKYAGCFHLTQRDETTFLVRPNLSTGLLVEEDHRW